MNPTQLLRKLAENFIMHRASKYLFPSVHSSMNMITAHNHFMLDGDVPAGLHLKSRVGESFQKPCSIL